MSKVEKIGRIDCSKDPVLTQQSAKDECDMNLIVAAAKRGADISHVNNREPMYGDFTKLPDYRSALIIVTQARQAFEGLDAFVRERFGNDPAKMLDFLNDPQNREEAVKLGLVKPKDPVKVSEPVEGEVEAASPASGVSDSKSRKPKASRDEE